MRIIADTGTDILEKEAAEMGVELVAIRASFKSETFSSNTSESFQGFYNLLRTEAELPVSSQPSPDSYLTIIEEAKEKQEDVLIITISSELSGTYNGAVLAVDMSEYDRAWVVDSLQASLSERMLVEYAVKLRDEGKGVEEIVGALMEARNRIHLTGVPADLKYLKKGGRISPIIARVGDVLGIKPVLLLKDGKIECRSKARGAKAAKAGMLALISELPSSDEMPIMFAHSNNDELGQKLREEMEPQLGVSGCPLHEVGPAIGTHIGPDAMLIAWMSKN